MSTNLAFVNFVNDHALVELLKLVAFVLTHVVRSVLARCPHVFLLNVDPSARSLRAKLLTTFGPEVLQTKSCEPQALLKNIMSCQNNLVS